MPYKNLEPCPFCKQHLVPEPYGHRHPYKEGVPCPHCGHEKIENDFDAEALPWWGWVNDNNNDGE